MPYGEGSPWDYSGTSQIPRIVVGISPRPVNSWALAWAIGEARHRHGRLVLVHVFRPAAGKPFLGDGDGDGGEGGNDGEGDNDRESGGDNDRDRDTGSGSGYLDFPGICRNPFANPVTYGDALICAAVRQAVGQPPGDVDIERRVVPGRAAAELVRCARGAEMLVLGSRRQGRLHRLAAGSVAHACERRASCPVVIVGQVRISRVCGEAITACLLSSSS